MCVLRVFTWVYAYCCVFMRIVVCLCVFNVCGEGVCFILDVYAQALIEAGLESINVCC